MSKTIEIYVIERDKMLEKYSVKALVKFVEEYYVKGYLSDTFYKDFMLASDLVKKLTLCKMIMNCKRISQKTKEKARKWLEKNKYSPNLY